MTDGERLIVVKILKIIGNHAKARSFKLDAESALFSMDQNRMIGLSPELGL